MPAISLSLLVVLGGVSVGAEFVLEVVFDMPVASGL